MGIIWVLSTPFGQFITEMICNFQVMLDAITKNHFNFSKSNIFQRNFIFSPWTVSRLEITEMLSYYHEDFRWVFYKSFMAVL